LHKFIRHLSFQFFFVLLVSTDKANEGLLADPNVQPSTSASGSVQSAIDGDAQQGSKGTN